MSRITPHCVCQSQDEHAETLSKAYSVLPNYLGKSDTNSQSPEFCKNKHSKNHKFSRQNECNVCTNYENIEHFISGSFRPHSCPSDDIDGCVRAKASEFFKESIHCNPKGTNEHNKFNRKGSRFSMKHDKLKFHDQLYMSKNSKNAGTAQRLDTIHQGLNFYINKGDMPILANNIPEVLNQSHRAIHRDTNVLFGDPTKKPSCGLKYIIFQKLSIMTHFLTKSKDKSSSLALDKKQLSDENLFKENQCHTKRSKSFHTMDAKENSFCDINYLRNPAIMQGKQRLYRTKGSDTSNSSTGSIDAHAGSPITIMSTACGNFLGGLSNPLMANAFMHGNSSMIRNEYRPPPTSPELMDFSHKKTKRQSTRQPMDECQTDPSQTCLSHQRYQCPNCLYPFQAPYHHPMVLDQLCQRHCISPLQPQYPAYHCCPHSHPHILMHPTSCSSACCSQSSHLCHCSVPVSRPCFYHLHQPNACQYSDTRVRSSLCQSCQYKHTKRCQSETLDDNRHFPEQSNQGHQCQQHLSNTARYKFKSEIKNRSTKLSPSTHSKSVASSIPPPPPPPPPSSLYSANNIGAPKTKHKKHSHSKPGKECTNCDVIAVNTTQCHSSECTNNVQNIIYSHLNNNIDNINKNIDSKIIINQELMSPSPEVLYSYDNPIVTNTSRESSKAPPQGRGDRDSYMDCSQRRSSRRQDVNYGTEKELFDRRSAEMFKEISTNYKPKFLSKTPETYNSKNDRRHKRHQCDVERISKHKSFSTTREYRERKESDLFYCDDSMESPEAGSFIYHPLSPMEKKNIKTVVPKKVSSLNNRQHCNYKDINFGRPELVRKAFQENMLSLREVGWYWGPLSFTEAESLMENKANGTFLVRDSGHDTYFLSLTFRVRETTYHTRIEYSQGTFSFWSQPESHSATTIVEFIDKAVAHSQSGKFHYFLLTNVPGQPPMEVSLLYPLSRHQIVHSLKHLSRFVILSHIRKDHITDLPVPPALRSYLLEKQYYISNLDEFVDMTLDTHPLSYKPSTTN